MGYVARLGSNYGDSANMISHRILVFIRGIPRTLSIAGSIQGLDQHCDCRNLRNSQSTIRLYAEKRLT